MTPAFEFPFWFGMPFGVPLGGVAEPLSAVLELPGIDPLPGVSLLPEPGRLLPLSGA